jgi:hypothetical protein
MARLEFVGLELRIAGCPNACRHCPDGHPPFGALMSVEDARWVMEQFRPMADVLSPYVMCDQTAHPDMLALQELCQEFGNDPEGSDWSVLSTNGHGIATSDDPEGLLRGFGSLGARALSFTLHGEREYHDWFVCRRGAFEDIWHTARLCGHVGLDTYFNFYVDRTNAADLRPLLDRAARLRDATGLQVTTQLPVFVLFWSSPRLRVYERKLRPRPADLEPVRDYLRAQWGRDLEGFTESNWVRRLLDPSDPLPRPQRPVRSKRSVGLIVDRAFDVWEEPPLREHAAVRHGNLKTDGPEAIMDRLQAWQPRDYPGVEELAALYGDPDSDLLHRNPTSLYVKWIDRWLTEHGGVA